MRRKISGNLFAFPFRKRKQNKISRFSFVTVTVSVRMARDARIGDAPPIKKHQRHAPAEWNLREMPFCTSRFWREISDSDTQTLENIARLHFMPNFTTPLVEKNRVNVHSALLQGSCKKNIYAHTEASSRTTDLGPKLRLCKRISSQSPSSPEVLGGPGNLIFVPVPAGGPFFFRPPRSLSPEKRFFRSDPVLVREFLFPGLPKSPQKYGKLFSGESFRCNFGGLQYSGVGFKGQEIKPFPRSVSFPDLCMPDCRGQTASIHLLSEVQHGAACVGTQDGTPLALNPFNKRGQL